jgi:hypothetical protein
VRNIGGAVVEPLELVEIAAPALLYGLRILQIRFVKRFDEGRIRAEQVRIGLEFFKHSEAPNQYSVFGNQ